MESSPLKEGTGVSYTESKESSSDSESAFICNICLEVTNKDPVVTQCGHLYCWPCLYRWLNTQHSTCPVCKAGVCKENVIPLFIRGSELDPRTKNPTESVPNRPAGRRPDPAGLASSFPFNNGNNPGGGNQYGGGMTFSAGLGFFPRYFLTFFISA